MPIVALDGISPSRPYVGAWSQELPSVTEKRFEIFKRGWITPKICGQHSTYAALELLNPTPGHGDDATEMTKLTKLR